MLPWRPAQLLVDKACRRNLLLYDTRRQSFLEILSFFLSGSAGLGPSVQASVGVLEIGILSVP